MTPTTSTTDMIANLAALGIGLTASGGRLRVEGPPALLTGKLLSQLASRKQELLEALALTDPAGQSKGSGEHLLSPADLSADWRVDWEERAAIMEYDGGLPREQAEARAFADILAQMRRAGARQR
ncbi:MAG: hypothetical protein BIFFINMI_02698 [Phycisphaerae bacterium]|nr:hypothetical protein [Phycisphaerae bacterium]